MPSSLSVVDVCNRALLRLGQPPITALDEGTASANALSLAYPAVRLALLRGGVWSFAAHRVRLDAAEDAPAWGYERAFPLPVDCLRLLQVGEVATDPPPFKLEGGSILTDAEAPLSIRYIRDVEASGTWDSCFAEALAAHLAAECCERITQSGTRGDRLERWAASTLKAARRAGALEQLPTLLPEHLPWQVARFSGVGGDAPLYGDPE